MKKFLLVILILLIPINIYSFNTSAECSILMEQDNLKILFGENIHKVKSVASISKIMTAIIAIESGKIDDTIVIDEEVIKAYGSAIYIQPGEEIKLLDLIYGLMLRSGNDAALAISKYVSGSVDEFVLNMNKKAKRIGMKNTTFHNPSGLDNVVGNYSTAYDMAVLTSYAMKNEIYQKIVKTKKHVVKTNKNVYSWTNKNKLLTLYKYATGGKTGFTEKAKRTLVTTASYKNLFDKAVTDYFNVKILKKGRINIIKDDYYYDKELYIKNNFSYPLKEEEMNSLYLKFEIEKKRILKDNQPVGIVKVMVGEKSIYEDDIYVRTIKKPHKKFWIRWFKHGK